MKTFRQIKKEWLKDPEFKKGYDDLDLEYKLIDALVRARAEKKLTQKQLADKIGIDQSALARFESGKISPTLSSVQRIASGLGLKITVK